MAFGNRSLKIAHGGKYQDLEARGLAGSGPLGTFTPFETIQSPGPWSLPTGAIPAVTWYPDGHQGILCDPAGASWLIRLAYRFSLFKRYVYPWLWRNGHMYLVFHAPS